MLLLCMIAKPVSMPLQLLFLSLQLHIKQKNFGNLTKHFNLCFFCTQMEIENLWKLVEKMQQETTKVEEEREELHHKWKVVSMKGCSSWRGWKVCRTCTSMAWKRCVTMFSASSSLAWFSCPFMPFVVSFLVHAFHHLLGQCVNMELSSLFFIV